MSFALGASECLHEQLTPFPDSSTRRRWQTSDHFQAYARFLVDSCQILIALLPCWIKSTWRSTANISRINQRWENSFGDAQSDISAVPRVATSLFARRLNSIYGPWQQPDRGWLRKNQPDKTDRAIGYRFFSINNVERAYVTTHCEFLTKFWPYLLTWPYLEGSRIAIPTDHNAVKWVIIVKECTRASVCWLLRLSEVEFEVMQCSGMKHQAAGALWHLGTTGTNQTLIEDEVSVPCITASFTGKRKGRSFVYAVPWRM